MTSDQALCSISCGPYKQVWAVGRKGCAFYRLGITDDKLEGEAWKCIEPPSGVQLKQISVNSIGVWAVDHHGRLYVRKEINQTFPEGSHWQLISIDPPVLSKSSNSTI